MTIDNSTLMIRSKNRAFYTEGATYNIDCETGKMEKKTFTVHQGIGHYSLDDAIKDMHKTVTETAQFYRNRHAFVKQRSKRKTLITTIRVKSESDNFFAKYYITYRKNDHSRPITVDTRKDAEQLITLE